MRRRWWSVFKNWASKLQWVQRREGTPSLKAARCNGGLHLFLVLRRGKKLLQDRGLLRSQVFRGQSEVSPSGEEDIYQKVCVSWVVSLPWGVSGLESERIEGGDRGPVMQLQRRGKEKGTVPRFCFFYERRHNYKLYWVGAVGEVCHGWGMQFTCIISLELHSNLWASCPFAHFTKYSSFVRLGSLRLG